MPAPAARRRALAALVVAALAAFGLIQAAPAQAAQVPAAQVPAAKASPTVTPKAATPITPGTPFTFTVPADGSPVAFSFAGVAGRRVVVTDSGAPYASVWSPGTPANGLTTTVVSGGYGELGVLSAAGTVTLSVVGTSGQDQTYTATVTLAQDITGTLPFGSALSPPFTAPGRNAEYTFAATQGQRLALKVSTETVTSEDAQARVAFTLTRPDGTIATGLTNDPLFGSQPIYAPTVLTADLDATGTWTLTVDPQGDTTGTVTFTASHPVDTVIAATSGPALALTYPGDGSDVRLTFKATVGQRVTLGVTASDLQAPLGDGTPSATVQATLLRPDGTVGGTLPDLTSTAFDEQGLGADSGPGHIDVAGTWTLLLHPEGSAKGTQTARLGLVTDQKATLRLGAATAVRVATPGQNVDYAVTGTPGESVVVTLDSVKLKAGADGGDSSSALALVYQLNSDGSRNDLIDYGSDGYATSGLPASGSTTIVVDPVTDSVGTASLTVRPPTVTKTALPLAKSTTVKIGRGNEVDYTFKGAVGRRLGIDLTAATFTTSSEGDGPGYGSLIVEVLRPDGSQFSLDGTNGGLVNGPTFMPTPALDAAGTWTVVLRPYDGASGTFTFTAQQPTDVTGTLSVGSPQTVKLGTPGQQARYTFHGLSGRRITFDVPTSAWSSLDLPDARYPTVTLYRPDGSFFGNLDYVYPYPGSTTGGYFSESSGGSPTGLLDASGTWTLVVAPDTDLVGSETFTVGEVQDVTGSTAFGPAKAIHLTTKGQQGHDTFTWDGNGEMSLTYKNSTISAGTFYVTGPDGNPQPGAIGTGSGTDGFVGSGQAGTWTLTVDPAAALTGSITVTLVPPAATDHRTATTAAKAAKGRAT